MILDFSVIGSGEGKQINLCSNCRFTVKISYPLSRVPQVAWLTGEEIQTQYVNKDVKLTVSHIKRCPIHVDRGSKKNKGTPAFLQVALKSGIDINEKTDEYYKKYKRLI